MKRVISACCAIGSTVIDHCHLGATERIVSIITVLVHLHCTPLPTFLPPSSPVMKSQKTEQTPSHSTMQKRVSWYLWTETGIYGKHIQKPAAHSASLIQSYLEVFKRVNVVLPKCPLVSTLIPPLNYFTDCTYVIGIYTLVESTPGEAKRNHLFTVAFYFNQPALSSFCLKLLLFTYLHFLLLSPVYTRKENDHNEIIRFKLPHPI